MRRIVFAVLAALGPAALGLAACETEPLGPPTPPPPPPAPAYHPPPVDSFRESDFTWSTASGSSRIIGALAYRGDNGVRYTCQGEDVVLSPETPWSRSRTQALYLSTSEAALPVDDVKARTRPDHGAEYAKYVRKTTCNAANRFAFRGLPSGAWYVITIATPVTGGQRMAVMRRVITSGGDVTAVLR